MKEVLSRRNTLYAVHPIALAWDRFGWTDVLAGVGRKLTTIGWLEELVDVLIFNSLHSASNIYEPANDFS